MFVQKFAIYPLEEALTTTFDTSSVSSPTHHTYLLKSRLILTRITLQAYYLYKFQMQELEQKSEFLAESSDTSFILIPGHSEINFFKKKIFAVLMKSIQIF